MRKYFYLCLLFLFTFSGIYSQQNNISANFGLSGGYVTSGPIPFWLRSNQFGSIPLDNGSLSLTGSFRRDYIKADKSLFDWGISLEGRMNIGKEVNFNFIEGYAKMHFGIFELKGGRVKDITGLCDTTLSSGSWSVSGNAPGIPKLEISVPEYYTIPFLGELFAFKGQFAHGWFGDVTMRWWPDTFQLNTYLHQKSLYGRFGKPNWRLKLYGGFNHQVFWGKEDIYYGDKYTLTRFETFYYMVIGKPYFNSEIPTSSKIGNHQGSIDVGLEYEFRKVKLLLYRQSVYEVGGLYYLSNILDGLNGLSLENRHTTDAFFKWKKFVFEFLYTINQGGRPWSPVTPTPYENYYNHYAYINGWTYRGVGLGNPFITPKNMVSDEFPSWPRENFINNRVRLFHVGLEGSIQKFNYILKASWSNNYGTYATSDEEQSTDIDRPGSLGIFGKKDQFSFYYTFNRELKKHLIFQCTTAFDSGELFEDSFGLLVGISKSF